MDTGEDEPRHWWHTVVRAEDKPRHWWHTVVRADWDESTLCSWPCWSSPLPGSQRTEGSKRCVKTAHANVFLFFFQIWLTWYKVKLVNVRAHLAKRDANRKPISYHHCHITTKYNLFKFHSFLQVLDACLIFFILRGLAPPPLSEFIRQRLGN